MREVTDGNPVAFVDDFQQGRSASQFNIVGMGSEGKRVYFVGLRGQVRFFYIIGIQNSRLP
jgi:hypothetical protein